MSDCAPALCDVPVAVYFIWYGIVVLFNSLILGLCVSKCDFSTGMYYDDPPGCPTLLCGIIFAVTMQGKQLVTCAYVCIHSKDNDTVSTACS